MNQLDWPRDGRHVFVGGAWTEVRDAQRIQVVSPSTEEVVGYVPAATAADVDRAVELISPCLREWAALGVYGRAPYLRAFAAALTAHVDELVELEIADGGLTRRSAKHDVGVGIESLSFYLTFAGSMGGMSFPAAEDLLAYTVREPFGIVARISPYNHPALFTISQAAPVLLAGNAVIMKPPEQASLSALAIAEVARQVFPPGVFNVMTGHGREIGAALVEHPAIPRIGFTGSVETGRRVMIAAAQRIKNVSLELGGKNPLVVASGSDPDLASDVAIRGMSLRYAGQSCESTTRLIVVGEQYDEVVEATAKKMEALVVGDPQDEQTDMGPVVSQAQYEKILGYVDTGLSEGSRLVTGGVRPDSMARGWFIAPTLFADVDPSMRIAREEIFGPVLVAIRAEDEADAIRIANDSELGLNARVVAPTFDVADAIGRELKAGTTLLNDVVSRPRGMPFGGYKQSGLGRQLCLDELHSYMEQKSVVASRRPLTT